MFEITKPCVIFRPDLFQKHMLSICQPYSFATQDNITRPDRNSNLCKYCHQQTAKG